MANEPITVNALAQTGRVDIRDPNLGNTFAVYNADFSSDADITLQFGVQSQGQTFGTPRSMFLDNGDNPNEVEVYVTGTDQFFTVPAFAMGYFTIEATASSNIKLVSLGGSTTNQATVIIYNWERPPSVWYKFGVFNGDQPVQVYGTMDPGADVAASDNNKPVFFGGIDGTGTFRAVRTDSLGRLDFTGASITLGGVYGADPLGSAPVNPGVNLALPSIMSGDLIQLFATDTGEMTVYDGAAYAKLSAIQVNTNPSTSGVTSNVAAAIADTSILTANAARKGGTVYNDSTAILYLKLGTGAASLTSYTVQVPADGFFDIGSYQGPVRGIWAAATGNARVTDFS